MESKSPKSASEAGNDRNDPATGDPGKPSSSTPTAPSLTRFSTTPLPSIASSTSSPKASRDLSPIHSNTKAAMPNAAKATRSRKGSQEFSPNRSNTTPIAGMPSVPSAAAIQRALSVAGTPQLHPPTSPSIAVEASKFQRGGREPTAAPVSNAKQIPPLKSPPPASKDGPQRRVESAPATPNIVIERSTPTPTSSSTTDMGELMDKHSQKLGSKITRPASGGGPALETVQERRQSVNAAPTGRAHHKDPGTLDENSDKTDKSERMEKAERLDRPARIDEDPMEEALAHDAKSMTTGTGSDSSDQPRSIRSMTKETTKATANHSSKPQIVRSKKSFTQLLPSRAKVQEGSTKGMTVETETVSTIPQVALGAAAAERTVTARTDAAGSLRLKPSNETIRPKKERRKVVRKAPSVNAGNASSKADIFEKKVADAIDQTNSSDSEETFVYESNPQEPLSVRPTRFHSRTPSATSVISLYDQHGGRLRSDGGHSVVGKKSMKFANSSMYAVDAADHGAVRGSGQNRMTSNSAQHHHIGRFGRTGNGHTSLFDQDSPFSNVSKALKTPTSHVARHPSRPSSPRSPHVLRMTGAPKHAGDPQAYDLEGDGADDERTPLIGSVRSNRSRNNRRPLPGTRYIVINKDRRLCRRITAYSIVGTLLALLAAAMVMVLLMCSKPLVSVYVKDIRNVLASEQEIMLDLHVRATNPNLIAVQVSDLDVNLFARSKHIGSNALRHDPGHGRPSTSARPDTEDALAVRSRFDRVHSLDGVDHGTDPIDDPDTDSSTMLLGRIVEFDSPLIFEPSPLQQQSLSSIGEVRLAKPGNRTEDGGTERWERVLLHDFELIVRGVLRYSLPISSKTRSVSIGKSVIVHPSDDLVANGTMGMSTPAARPRHDSGTHGELRPGCGAPPSFPCSGPHH